MTGSSRLGAYTYANTPAGHLHAPSNIGPIALTYDANGNMTTDGTTYLQFDVLNHPISAGGVAMSYDGNGKRYKLGAIFMIGDVYEFDQSTFAATRYYFFNGMRIASAKYGAGTYYHGDQLNSATTLTDFTGAVIGRQILSPYGRRLGTNTTNEPICLAGQTLASTRLFPIGHRQISPSFRIVLTPNPQRPDWSRRPATGLHWPLSYGRAGDESLVCNFRYSRPE